MQLGVLAGSQLMGGFGMRLAFMGASAVGSLLMNGGKKKPQGKLNDIRVSSSTYGRGIPIVYGTMRVTGNLFWTTDFVEEKYLLTQKGKEVDGKIGEKLEKKGKAQEFYEYFANYAMGLCEGPVEVLLRVWADNNKIYDRLNPNDKEIVDIGFTRQDAGGEGKAQQKSPARKKGHQGDSGRFEFRFYPGTEEQLPDPFMVSQQGADQVPAFRGLCYLMFERFALADFGNRIPTITAEISIIRQRRPLYMPFEPLPGDEVFTQPISSGGSVVGGKLAVDPLRRRLYHTADIAGTGRAAIRVWDLDTKKEIKRIFLGPGLDTEELLQSELTGYEYTKATDIMNEKNGQYVMMRSDLLEWIGIACGGELVFAGKGTNYTRVHFVDPDSLQLLSTFGGASNTLGPGVPYRQIAHPETAYPLVGIDEETVLQPQTAVRTKFGGTWFFDVNFRLVGYASYSWKLLPGVPGTDSGMITFNGRRVYTTKSIGRYKIMNEQGEQVGVNIKRFGTEFGYGPYLMYEWPHPGSGVVNDNGTVKNVMYCVGADCICVIATNKMNQGHVYAVKLDKETGEVLWMSPRITGISGLRLMGGNGVENTTPMYLPGNGLVWFDAANDRVIHIDFRAETVETWFTDNGNPSSAMAPTPDSFSPQYYWGDLDMVGYYTTATAEYPNGTMAMVGFDRNVQVPVSIGDVCIDVSRRVGIPLEKVDVSGLREEDFLIGYMIEQPTDGKSVLQELADVFMFDAVESDFLLKFKTRGSESVVAIPQVNLGIVENDFNTENEYFTETRIQEIELPRRVTMSYLNPKEKYEQGTEGYSRPLRPLNVMNSQETLELTLNAAMDYDKAKALAMRICFVAWAERTSNTFTLPRDYLALDTSDVITVNFENGQVLQGRLTDIEIGDDLTMRVTTVKQIPDAYSVVPQADDRTGGVIAIPISMQPPARAAVFDLPYVSDSDVEEYGEFIIYWAAMATGNGFRSGTLISRKAGEDLKNIGHTSVAAIWGYLRGTAVPPPPVGPEFIDYETELTLIPGYDFNTPDVIFNWESLDEDEFPSESNMLIIGDEIILFKDVVENPDGSVMISTLIRGYRGSYEAAYKHAPGERWVLVHDATLRDDGVELVDRNVPKQWGISTSSGVPAFAYGINKTLTGASRRPLPVGDVRRSQSAGSPGTITVNWRRATRYNGQWVSGSGSNPLNEQSELYEIFLLKAPYDPTTWDPSNGSLYWFTAEDITSPSYTFTDENGLTAAGATYQSDIHVVIYQHSGVVDRGFPSGHSLLYSVFGL